MRTHLLQVIEAERTRRFPGLTGSRADTVLPVRQPLIDAVLGQVRRLPAPLEAMQLRVAPGNRLHLAAVIRVLGFKTRVRLALRLAPAMDNGRVRLFLDDRSFVANAISWLGPLVGQLPGGVALQGNQIVVDVPALAARLGLADLAALVSAASFETEDGVLWVNARVEVPDAGARESEDGTVFEAGDPAERTRSGAGQQPAAATLPFRVDDLVAWLSGMRLDADVRVEERLVNELLGAAHADAQRSSEDAPDLATIMARALQRPTLRFEQGAIRVSAAADLRPQPVDRDADPRNT